MSTDFSNIEFNATWHRYFYAGRELTSVTAKIKDLQKPFDQQAVAARVAGREGKTVEQVLAEWNAKGEASRTNGTAVHAHIEKVLTGKLDPRQQSFDGILDLNPKLPEVAAFDDLWGKLAPTVDIYTGCIEWVIGDAELGLAGTVDCMLLNQQTKQYNIFDWKTGKFDTANTFENLLPPFAHLDASKLNIYSLQVNLYRLMIERNTDLKLGDCYIVHLAPTGYQIHKAADLRPQLLGWLQREMAHA